MFSAQVAEQTKAAGSRIDQRARRHVPALRPTGRPGLSNQAALRLQAKTALAPAPLRRACAACDAKEKTSGVPCSCEEAQPAAVLNGETAPPAAATPQRIRFVRQSTRIAPVTGPHARSGEGGPEDEALGGVALTGEADGGLVQRQDAGTPPAKPKVKKTTVSGPTMGDCGAFSWGAQWSIDNATASTDGFVVQHVAVSFDMTVCPGPVDVKSHTGGKVDPSWWPLWEAWQVRGGKVFVGTTAGAHKADTYAMPTFGESQGTIEIKGTAEYFDGATLPAGFVARNSPPAMALPYTQTDPKLAGGTGSIAHDIKVSWDCCPQSSKTNKTQLVSSA